MWTGVKGRSAAHEHHKTHKHTKLSEIKWHQVLNSTKTSVWCSRTIKLLQSLFRLHTWETTCDVRRQMYLFWLQLRPPGSRRRSACSMWAFVRPPEGEAQLTVLQRKMDEDGWRCCHVCNSAGILLFFHCSQTETHRWATLSFLHHHEHTPSCCTNTPHGTKHGSIRCWK